MSNGQSERPDTTSSSSSSSDDDLEVLSVSESGDEESVLTMLRAFHSSGDASTLLRLLARETGTTDLNLLRRVWVELACLTSSPRERITQYSSLDDAVALIRSRRRIMVVSGAGISVSCGIPDFRSKDGLYATLHERFPGLADPQQIFDISYFVHDPKPFFSFAKEIYPDFFQPSLTHRFIRCIEEEGKLLRHYTQNIDSLEKSAGIQRVVYCHGSFATASCMVCFRTVPIDEIRSDIMLGNLPMCDRCGPLDDRAIMKPDIVFFGEGLPSSFVDSLGNDTDVVDLLLVVGSSMKVGPVNRIPKSVPHNVPQILINREPLNAYTFDVELLGDCDVIFKELALRLGGAYSEICADKQGLVEVMSDQLATVEEQPAASTSSSSSSMNGTLSKNIRKSKPSPKRRLPRIKVPDGHFVYKPPNRYLFRGAEV